MEGALFGGRTANAMRSDELASSSRRPQDEEVSVAGGVSAASIEQLRDITWRHAGILRNATGLAAGLETLGRISEDLSNRNLLSVARVIHESALAREESRGAH